jgi:hypothetical protein
LEPTKAEQTAALVMLTPGMTPLLHDVPVGAAKPWRIRVETDGLAAEAVGFGVVAKVAPRYA